MPKYTRQHYEDVAKLLKEYNKPLSIWGYPSDETQAKYDQAEDITKSFVELFKQDNPNFDEKRFLKAAQR